MQLLLLDDYSRSYRSHEAVLLEIEAQHPQGAARAMHEHFVIMDTRGHKCQLVRVGDAASP